MSDSTCCPACGDSPLSITGNITGILTFASTILATSLLFLTVVRSAENEMRQLRASVEQAGRHLDAIVSYFHGLDLVADPDLAFIKGPINSALRDWHATNENLIEQLKELESIRPAIRRQLVWWHRHDDILAGMTKLRSEKDDLFALLLTYMSSLQQAKHPVRSSLETREVCGERDKPRYGIVRDERISHPP
ncbi:hypothetical protein RB597_000042 [Gaeumannomyces tritici]